MTFLENIGVIFTSMLESLGLAWWVKVVTYQPCCTYYFGSSITVKEAKLYQGGYIENLEWEEAKILMIEIEQGQSKELTICQEELPESINSSREPVRGCLKSRNCHPEWSKAERRI